MKTLNLPFLRAQLVAFESAARHLDGLSTVEMIEVVQSFRRQHVELPDEQTISRVAEVLAEAAGYERRGDELKRTAES